MSAAEAVEVDGTYVCGSGHWSKRLEVGPQCPECGNEAGTPLVSLRWALGRIDRAEAFEDSRPTAPDLDARSLAQRASRDELVQVRDELARAAPILADCGSAEDAAEAERYRQMFTEAVYVHDRAELARPATPSRLALGGSWILDAPDELEARWGAGSEVLWPCGEPLVIAAPPGVGKTTLAVQVVAAMIGVGPSEVLGLPVKPADRVLYLAMDRPRQIQRAMRRVVTEEHRQALDERLVVWQGPPPQDLAADPHALEVLAANAGADVVVVDSLKDAAVKLSDDEVGGKVNRAVQNAVTAGIDVLALHHQRKGQHGSKPTTLEDVYGSTWITAGAGSVVLLWGQAGDLVVELTHLKQPAETVGPLRILHDHAAGTSSVVDGVDLVALAAGSEFGLTVRDAARAIFEKDEPTRNEAEKARRRLDRLAESGVLVRTTAPRLSGGTPPTVYRTAVDALVDVAESSHAPVTQGGRP